MPVPRPRACVAALLLPSLAACHDASGPSPSSPSGVSAAAVVVAEDSAPPVLRSAAPGSAPAVRLTLDRVAPVPPELGPVVGAHPEFSAANVRELDLVRWSPDGRTIAAVASRSDLDAAVVLLFDVAGDSARPASLVGTSVSGLDWSPDGSRLAYAGGAARGPRSNAYGVGVTEVATRQSRRLFLGDMLGWVAERIPEAVRWDASGRAIYFAVWRRDLYGDLPGHEVSTLYAVDATTRALRVVRDSVAGRVAEISRAGDFVLLLRDPTYATPPSPPDFRRLVRLDLATGRETVLLDAARIRAARLTHRDDYVLVTRNAGQTADAAPRTVLETDLLTIDGRALGTVARQTVGQSIPFVWGKRRVDVRVP